MTTGTQVVVLDAAGTLVELRHSVGEAYAELALREGASLDPVAIEAGFRAAFRAAPPLAFGAYAPTSERDWWHRVAGAAIASAGPLPVEFDFERFFDHAYDWFATDRAWRVPADVKPALRDLRRAGFPLAILSNWDSRLEPLLEQLGLGGFFAQVIVSGLLPAAKPERAAFDAARTALGSLADHRPPIMVGDRIDHDIQSAMDAGWKAIWLDRLNLGGDLPDGAERVADLRHVARLARVADRS
jgi:putative hydrolase of the HAD superfamily